MITNPTNEHREQAREMPERVFAVVGETGAVWATFDTREKAERYPGPRMLELAPRRVVEYARVVSFNSESKAKEIVEEYKQRVAQLPSDDVIPCTKWLETRLRIAFDLSVDYSPTVAAALSDNKDPYAKLRDLITLVCDAAFNCGDCEEHDDGEYKSLWETEQSAITNLKNYVIAIQQKAQAESVSALSSRDAEIREVLISLATKVYASFENQYCWCSRPTVATKPEGDRHDTACLAARALWEKMQGGGA